MDIGKASHQKISWFFQRHQEGSLELAPPFQRKPVWSLNNKSYLVDTIIKGLPIPEIYMQIKTDETGETKYIIVDGQQRLRAILEYLSGEYELLESDNPEYGGKEFQDLPSGIKQEIWNYDFVVRELSTSSDEDIRHIFQRLNKNVVPLNRQELRNATYMGEFMQLMLRLAEEDSFWSDNKIVSPNDIKRMINSEFVSEMFIGMMHGVQQKNQDLLDKFYKMYDEDFQDKEDWKKKFTKIQLIINDIFEEDLRPVRWHNKNDFYSLFLAINGLLEEYLIPSEKYSEIKKALEEFIVDVYRDVGSYEFPTSKEYYENVIEHSTNKENRQKRINALRQVLIPFLIPKDSRRTFSEEERRIFWHLSKDKLCALCGKEVTWNDYEIDHKIPHSKGGKTCLENAQITHKSCNSSKGDN